MSHKVIHQRHIEHWAENAADESRTKVQESWFDTNTADNWRHKRMYEAIDCFIHRPNLSFLTVGDGRFGLDAIRISQKGFKDVTPTDISDALLKVAKSKGLIKNYLIENAESLSLSDESYDVVFCKESYHHFPRAPLALYEMIRVSKFAVVLVEPRDIYISTICTPFVRTFRHLWSIVRYKMFPFWKKLPTGFELYGDGLTTDYESSGNYIYSMSPREVEKVALGSNLPAVAFKGIGDCYVKGGEFADASSEVGRTIQSKVKSQEKAFYAGSRGAPLLVSILFKEMPDEMTIDNLKKSGFYIKKLPRNPYLNKYHNREIGRKF